MGKKGSLKIGTAFMRMDSMELARRIRAKHLVVGLLSTVNTESSRECIRKKSRLVLRALPKVAGYGWFRTWKSRGERRKCVKQNKMNVKTR